jgi:hypothetical protein
MKHTAVAALTVISVMLIATSSLAADRRPQLARAAVEELIDRVDIIFETVPLASDESAALAQAIREVRVSMRAWDLNDFDLALQQFTAEIATLVQRHTLSRAQGQGIVDGLSSVLQYLADISFVPQAFATTAVGSFRTGYDLKIGG